MSVPGPLGRPRRANKEVKVVALEHTEELADKAAVLEAMRRNHPRPWRDSCCRPARHENGFFGETRDAQRRGRR